MQIESFRKMVVEKKIKEKDFAGAKKLVHNYINQHGRQNTFHRNDWDAFILQIAQGEKDIPVIRDVSYSFIKDRFADDYYRIYKSTFSAGEWAAAYENLLRHYENKNGFYRNPAADLLAAEKDTERLINYIEKKLSLENLETYHKFFAAAFPEKTLALFRKAIDHYAEQNTGRSCYGRIAALFNMMKKISGGDALVNDMKAQYKITYKNRPAMMEVLKIK
jgi:hypothetical protein